MDDFHGGDLLEDPAELEGGPAAEDQHAEEDSAETENATESLSEEVRYSVAPNVARLTLAHYHHRLKQSGIRSRRRQSGLYIR